MPLKTWIPSTVAPRTLPAAVSAIGSSAELVERNGLRRRRDILNGANRIVLPITPFSLRVQHFAGGNLLLWGRLRGDNGGKSESCDN